MNHLVIASTEADAAAAAAIEQHHAQLAGALDLRVTALVDALSHMDGDAALAARDDLVAWSRTELVPHAVAEEKVLYPVAHGRPEARLLVDAMVVEHGVLTRLVDDMAVADDVLRAGVAAGALREVFHSHLAKENEQLLPMLTSAPEVSLTELLSGMHDLLRSEAEHALATTGAMDGEPEAGCGGHGCTCGEVDAPGYPELDARTIPHAIRHATIFGALEAVTGGGGMVLVAPHDPLPLLGQVDQRYPGTFTVDYLERGPEVWRLAFLRTAP
jgi:uncharacterized protein (DUF2249 family)/iron-sulfur cluster repair protein YtfE (RIC family)